MERTEPPHLKRPTPATSWNADYIESLYHQWLDDPTSMPETWQYFFQGFELAMCPRDCVAAVRAAAQSKVASLIYAYRSQGHFIAQLDPLGDNLNAHPDLALDAFGLTDAELDTVFDTGHLVGPKRASLREILSILKDTYCRSIGVEYIHIQDRRMRRWLQARMEPARNRPSYDAEIKRQILENLIDAELFETFVHTRYRGQKRFSLEGAETLIAAVHRIVERAPEVGVQEIILGMAHRGRLNVLANILDKSYGEVFSEFEDSVLPESFGGDSDVKYHKGFSSDHVNRFGRSVHLSLTANPSHLEAVDPVVQGKARAKQQLIGGRGQRQRVLPLLIHGDAAFAGQGVVAETLNLSQLEGYHTGGTVHIIVNNQIGFTTLPGETRSSAYATDVARMVEAPVFHVNGDDPEATAFVAELALDYRQEFGRDVVVDMLCYRRHGHNEGDEPEFTQPVLYRKVRNRPPVLALYTEQLIAEGNLAPDGAQRISEDFQRRLQAIFETVREHRFTPDEHNAFKGVWAGLGSEVDHQLVDTGVDQETIIEVARGLSRVPRDFTLNPKVARQVKRRLTAVEEGGAVDWANAEALAFGTLLLEDTPVRLSGQDSKRGTFSQRHSVWHDFETQAAYVPANHIRAGQAQFAVHNSSLSEAGVLGFEYGYSLAEPRTLVLWEAQFGDFANGAQVIIDQFIVAAQSKWNRSSGLVMLLPHGYEGQGPEHSNAYLERYLSAAAENNIQVCNCTTPAQYFHLLRRQTKVPFRRPLIIMTPKSLLRHRRVVSPVAALVSGRFVEMIDDLAPPERPRRVVLCSGKVFYDLLEGRAALQASGDDPDVALIRLEQLYPLNRALLEEILGRYADVESVVWAQEEPANRGGWCHVRSNLSPLLGGRPIHYVGRRASASPATGSLRRHKAEQAQIVEQALRGPLPAQPNGDGKGQRDDR